MPDPATGVIAGTSLLGAGMSSSAANRASRRAEAAQAEALAFEKKRYEDWKNVYGPIQDNLSNFYSNLTPEYFETLGLESHEKQMEQVNENMRKSFASRGIDMDSEMAQYLTYQTELQSAETKAGIRRDAVTDTIEAKQGFLSIGLRQDPSNSYSRALGSQAQRLGTQAADAADAYGDAMQSAITQGGAALAEYFENQGTVDAVTTGSSPGLAIDNRNGYGYT